MTKQTILVTGSSRGIGRAIALKLARDGYPITLHCRSGRAHAEAVRSEIEQIGQAARILQFDIADRNQCRSILEEDIETHGAYYGVICNAGLARDNAFPALTEDDWDQVLHTNLDGFYNVLHPVIMPMIRRRKPGRIVTLSSISGMTGNRGQVNYSASKAGIIGASKALAVELAKRNITVNCVAPGLIETDMTSTLAEQQIDQLVPMKRMGKPEEIAATVGFLMSEGASYITRQVIAVNGGMYG
ncbi:MAG: 3-ketoacyl-ACP reductase FabG2 [Gammaproteobacteria bacterium]|nr:3-ketoacyl-ACP reductase FabG2 [Gammaproteobacteria bacterium]